MAQVVGVRFKQTGKIYFFDPDTLEPEVGQGIIVETQRGVEMGKIALSRREVEDAQVTSPLRKIIRIATPEDEQREQDNRRKEKEALPICQEKAEKHGLDMRVVDVEYSFDGSKIVFFFTAEGRVDFRELVKDLAGTFHARIELRQIGVRDEAKMLGGIGPCGRIVCCNAYLGDFQPVSIKMAKEQNLSLNPTKISGLCGRLFCCLKYEQDTYEQTIKKMPRVGSEIETPDGTGTVMENNLIRERVKVRLSLSDGTFDLREYPIEDLNGGGEPRRRGDGENYRRSRRERERFQREVSLSKEPREDREENAAQTETAENSEAETSRPARRPGQRRGSRGGRSRGGRGRRDGQPRQDGEEKNRGQNSEQRSRNSGSEGGEKEFRRGGYRSGQL